MRDNTWSVCGLLRRENVSYKRWGSKKFEGEREKEVYKCPKRSRKCLRERLIGDCEGLSLRHLKTLPHSTLQERDRQNSNPENLDSEFGGVLKTGRSRDGGLDKIELGQALGREV